MYISIHYVDGVADVGGPHFTWVSFIVTQTIRDFADEMYSMTCAEWAEISV